MIVEIRLKGKNLDENIYNTGLARIRLHTRISWIMYDEGIVNAYHIWTSEFNIQYKIFINEIETT